MASKDSSLKSSSVIIDGNKKENGPKFKCCETKLCKVVVCSNCSAAYHYSCAERIGNVKLQSELGGILTFTCCQPKTEGEYSENVKILRLTLENNMLRQLLEEVRDKNLILKENNSLLIQRFTSLEKTLSSEKTLTKNGQTEAQNVNNARQIDNDKRASVSVIPTDNYLVFSGTLSDTNPKKTHDPTPISTISSEVASGTTSYSMVLKNNPNAISSNATEIGNNVPNNKQENGNRRDLTKNSPAPESDDKQTWQTQKRRRINKNKISVGRPGENEAMSKLQPIVRRSWIYLSNLNNETTPKDILDCLDQRYSNQYVCEKINKKYESRVASFRLGVPMHMENEVKSLNFWLAGTFVDSYRFPKKRVSSDNTNFHQAQQQQLQESAI
ncbi:hypothetical protein JTB14_037895 [Gonioctena quinquepunctata]|nr:hypothetical protein JTB14_037895 [Gonioctena quinquepunctata]